jgi:hypothetical protein
VAKTALAAKRAIITRFVVVFGGCSNRPFSKKAKNLCDFTQYAYAE